MQTLSEIRALLAERNLRPKRRFGQHFLHDKNLLRKLVAEARIEPGDVVLEVGPGTGSLTEALLDRGAEVVACEIDRGLAAIIIERFGGRVCVIQGDCLSGTRALNLDVAEALGNRPFRLVSNLPFQVAATLVMVLLVHYPQCHGQFVTVQKEVADRLMAEPGTKAFGPLAVIVGALAEIRQVALLKPSCFWPQPEVDSAMCALRRRVEHALKDPAALAAFAGVIFRSRRKQLGRILGRRFSDWPAGVTPETRPEALAVGQVIELWRNAGGWATPEVARAKPKERPKGR